jgi:hypothetical protein
MDVWGAIQMLHPNFIYLAPPTLRYRTGIAVRYA